MDTKKQDTDLSTEELLRALDTKTIEESFITSDPVFSFIQTFGFRQGKTKVKFLMLYDLFKQWNKFAHIKDRHFYNELQKYFVSNNNASLKVAYFLLNKDALEIMKHLEKYKKPNTYGHVKYKAVQKRFDRFIKAYDIKAGDLYIESDIFYHIYDTWVYRNKIGMPFSYEKFVNICHLYFDAKRFNGSELEWFGLDSSIKQYISTQAVSNWRQGRAKRGKKSKVSEEDQQNIIYPETQK
jgi:hypothetical protein